MKDVSNTVFKDLRYNHMIIIMLDIDNRIIYYSWYLTIYVLLESYNLLKEINQEYHSLSKIQLDKL